MAYANKKVDSRIADEGVPFLIIHVGDIANGRATTTTRDQDANTYARELPNESLFLLNLECICKSEIWQAGKLFWQGKSHPFGMPI
jgi:hypothetical protein